MGDTALLPTRRTAGSPAAWSRVLGGRWWLLPLAVFAFTRVVGALAITLQDDGQLIALPGSVETAEPSGSAYLTALGNWDGQWYERIATDGYPTTLPRTDGEVAQNAWAFYPALPALSRLLMELTGLSFAAAASVVAMLAGAGAACVLFAMLSETADRFSATTGVLSLGLFPAAPVLQAAYTESLALLLVLASLLAMRRERYVVLGVLVVLLSLTRPVVLPVALVIGLHWLARWWRRRDVPFPAVDRRGLAACAAVAVASFAVWPVVVGVVTGEPGAYVATQRAWVLSGGGYPSWLGNVSTPGGRAALVVAVLVLGGLLALLLRPRVAPWGPELRTWAFVYVLYLLAATRPIPSIIRFALLAVVPWWPVLRPRDAVPLRRRTQVLVVGSVVALGVVGQFWWVHAFFVNAPGHVGYP